MYKNLLTLITAIAILSSCSNDSDGGNARLQVALIDAPAEYDAVNIDVQEVNVKFGVASEAEDDETEGEETEAGWINYGDFEPQTFDLLKLVNGEEEILLDQEIPSGTLGEIRLVLGDNNTMVKDGVSYDLTIPSGASSGLKIKINEDLLAGVTYKLVLDFDAAKSIVEAGNSEKYNLKPVIHAAMEAQTGAISGTVTPAVEGIVVYAITGADSISSYTSADGLFLLRALEAGTYDVAAVSETDTVSTSDVVVVVGQVTNAGELEFPTEE